MKGVKNFLYAGLAALVMNLSSCEKQDSFEPENKTLYSNDNPSLYEHARKLENENLIAREFNYEDAVLYFSEPLDDSYYVGMILGSAPTKNLPNGLCVRLNSLSLDRKNAVVYPMPIDKVVKSGSFSFDQYLNPDNVSEKSSEELYSAKGVSLEPSSARRFDFSFDNVLYDHDGNSNTTDDQGIINGELSVEINPYLEFNLNESETSLSSGISVNGHAGIYIKANSNISFSKEIPVWDKYLRPITIPVSGWPVVLVPRLRVSIGTEAKSESYLYTGITDDLFASAGISWEKGEGWNFSKYFENKFHPVTPEIDFNVSASAYAKLNLDLLVYGGPGPYGSIKTSLDFSADIYDNPWWNLEGNLKTSLGINPSFLSFIIDPYEKEIFSYTKHITDAGGPFSGGEEPSGTLDSLIIQPGPEGKDSWIKLTRWPDCSETYPHSGDGETINIFVDYFHPACNWDEQKCLIEFSNIPNDIDLVSSKLEFYGHFNSHYGYPSINLSVKKLKNYWDEFNVDWLNQPEDEKIREVEIPETAESSWHSIDVTSVVFDWINNDLNYGLSISGAEQGISGMIYSSDNPDAEHRPRLKIYYNKQN